MKDKKLIISLIFLFVLIIISAHFFFKADHREGLLFIVLFCTSIIIIPLVVSSLFWFFKKSLFHPVFWIFTTLVLILLVYLKQYGQKIDPYDDKKFFVANEYFEKTTGFFTYYRSMITTRVDNEATNDKESESIKCLYLSGKNVFIGKVLIDSNNKIIKVFYNQKILSDTAFARKEFGKAITDVKELHDVLDDILNQ